MPAPLAKGIIVTVSVLVAAGVAVYQSPQFQQWVTTSRRKIALALHNLGDEIQPRDSASPIREDISMTEDVGEAAEERRRIAKAEIRRRAVLLESRHNKRQSQQLLGSFDTLVDQDGHLRPSQGDLEHASDVPAANSTGVDTGVSHLLRRGGASNDNETPSASRDQLRVEISSDTMSHHPSESILQYTPTSEVPDELIFDPFADSPARAQTPVSISISSHTEENDQVYYAAPNSSIDHQQDLLADLEDLRQNNNFQHPVSSAPSTAGSYGHIERFSDESSDGTLSDLGDRSVGIATPASWSDVGSVVSNDDAGHHQLI
ncbi:hypothetical protein N7462_005483 [Penicillium macrosclerotiorum]|uniref:uncharacterized protein n=1 Tax=Penicillium macrosclerotiorum TaxID=303699 RepID=UPI002547E963|nr:uncharacterized protein N7462_005483 [Penicillium macrosclerotiorum]KAJ5682318.1 hypothetical protein N7462_005483 [Penicillium macrosclerotiorum]